MKDNLSLLPSLCVQAKEVVPDPELVRKLNWFCSPLKEASSGTPSSLELAYITDFFLALTICNSVVVSSPVSLDMWWAHDPRVLHFHIEEQISSWKLM